jgi:isoquinoline 1-oxidoreductase subunit beta
MSRATRPPAKRQAETEQIAGELERATLNSAPIAQSDTDRAMANAVTKVEVCTQVPFLAHATMEPTNCTVHVREDSCEVWVGQRGRRVSPSRSGENRRASAGQGRGSPSSDRWWFGRRLEIDGVLCAVQIARQVDGPLKVVWTGRKIYSAIGIGRISSTGYPLVSMEREAAGMSGAILVRSFDEI